MRPKTVILMVVAIGCGLTASYMTSRVIAERKSQDSTEKVAVIVPRQNIMLGTMLKEPDKLFEEKMVSEDSVPKRALRDLNQVKGKMAAKSINAEAYVFPEDFMDKDRDTLSQGMPPGSRAVSIRVDPETSVAGFVLPNSRVDVIVVGQMTDFGDFSTVLLQNVLVLAVDATPVRPDDKVALTSQTVTVALTPEEAAKVALAATKGRMRLVLRGYGDEVIQTVKIVRPTDIIRPGGQSGGDGTPAGEGTGAAPTPSGPSIGSIPDAPSPDKATPLVENGPSEARPEIESRPEPPKTHILTIYNGETVTKATYVMSKDGEASAQIERSDPATPATRPEPAAKPEADDDENPPEAKPAKKGGKPVKK